MHACFVWTLRAHVEGLPEGRHTHGPPRTDVFLRSV